MVICLAAMACFAPPAGAVNFTFDNITSNSVADATIGERQLGVSVDFILGQVSFIFTNLGPESCSITDIYFQSAAFLGTPQIASSAGVSFSQNAAPPELPGGNTIGFVTAAGFSFDSNHPVQPNGVNPGEWVQILFDLQNGQTFEGLIAALNSQDFRIGIHVQGFADGDSESFVNHIPEPSLAVLGISCLAVLGIAARRRRTLRA